jgi:uncharacterized protein (DUF885 family)
MRTRTLVTALCLLTALAAFSPSSYAGDATSSSALASSQADPLANPEVSHEFNHLVEQYFDFYFQFHPTDGTSAGFHQYDAKLEDLSPAGREAEISGLCEYLERFRKVPEAQLSEISAGDLEFLINTIQARLLALQQIQMWRKDPDRYTSTFSYSIFVIMARNFAPAEDRLRSVIAREQAAPKMFAAARHNLDNPPYVYTKIALQQLPGTIKFFRHDVPAAFSSVTDAKLLDEFKKSNQTAVSELEKYQNFLQQDLLPVSHGDFRIGAENFRKKLLYEEMVDIPLDRLLEIGYADLHRNQQRLEEVAAQIDPKHTSREVLAGLQKDHPAPNQLLPTFRRVLVSLRQFIEQHSIITIPSEVLPIVEETPPFERALTTAAMDTPGAYETNATEAMFDVTLPDPSWNRQKTEEWMEGFNRGTIVSTAIHEVYPGHYVQFLWSKRMPSRTRKLLYCNTNSEGWAHYTEQMMLDEGYGNGDPKLRLGQLDDALLRDARFIVGIQMHTGKMTLDEATRFFIKEGYQVPPVAEEEAKRGTSDPTYLYYTLGKLQILKLRADYEKMKGSKFSLLEFHDRFMEQGGMPLKIIRKAMLGNDSPTL